VLRNYKAHQLIVELKACYIAYKYYMCAYIGVFTPQYRLFEPLLGMQTSTIQIEPRASDFLQLRFKFTGLFNPKVETGGF
jgi:hypothetical protein